MTHRTLFELADLCGAVLEGDGTLVVDGPASLREADGQKISFFDPGNPRYRPHLDTTRAAAVVVPEGLDFARSDLSLLRCGDPSRAFTLIVESFTEGRERPEPGVHETAVLDSSVSLGSDVHVGPHCIVGADSSIGSGACLLGRVFLGRRVHVGEGTLLHPGVVLGDGVSVGANCILQPGAVIGSDGFGFERSGGAGGDWSKIPQLGSVVIEDDVEIGANCTIDCGRFEPTRILRGAKIDNLVQLGHNVEVGEGALLVAQVGVSGSTRIGKGAILAGQVGVGGHLEIGEGARVGGQAGVTRSLPPNRDYWGTPVRPRSEVLRALATAGRLPGKLEELERRVEDLERRLADSEGGD